MNTNDSHACYMFNVENKTRVFQLFSYHLIDYIHKSSKGELMDFLYNPECLEVIQEYSYEVLEIVIMIMNEEHGTDKKQINNSCADVMVFLATNCNANELVLYIVEQMEQSETKSHFQLLFHSLQLCLLRCKSILKMLDMCMDAIATVLKNLPLPSEEFSNDRNDHVVEETVLFYIYMNNFIDNIYRESISLNTSMEGTAVDLKYHIFKLIFSSFSGVFSNIDMSNDICQFIFHKVLTILYTEFDPIYLINLKNNIKIEMSANQGSNENVKRDCLTRFNHHYSLINMTHIQLSNASWMLLCSEKKSVHVPLIYNPIYIMFSIMHLSNCIIHQSKNQDIVILRVLNLVNSSLNANRLPISMEYIDSIVHAKFMQNIMNLAVRSDSIKVQKYVINTFIQYINKFEIKPKYRILQKVITLNCHVKMIGIAIVLFKDTVAQSYSKETSDQEGLFFVNNIQEFISKICHLKDGIDTDLIEMSDQIIPTLNFMIFLAIKKQSTNEGTQLLRACDYEFLKLLNQLVKVQLKEWKRYLEHLNEDASENHYDYFDKLKPSMKTMSVMPKNQQIFMCHQATNTLFIVQDLVKRICELTNFSMEEEYDSKSAAVN